MLVLHAIKSSCKINEKVQRQFKDNTIGLFPVQSGSGNFFNPQKAPLKRSTLESSQMVLTYTAAHFNRALSFYKNLEHNRSLSKLN